MANAGWPRPRGERNAGEDSRFEGKEVREGLPSEMEISRERKESLDCRLKDEVEGMKKCKSRRRRSRKWSGDGGSRHT
jgi:hypothetical protein